ncbi:hypothetical protein [Chryseobacterium candidae]|uniref:Uncharacterized protein n=1 Tax=Chryseobacterium candidae TaxID=1978493 RepID=A0ABY2R8J0_9FLAO|nr:hypothetical protein [Chryseobacterium candidae]THV61924.1 hypothetical protein EK417_08425 [Chryseobacterium candidae]
MNLTPFQLQIFDFINAYRIEKSKIRDQYVQEIKDLAKTNSHEAKVLAVKHKINLGLYYIEGINKALEKVPIDLNLKITIANGVEVSKLDLVKQLLLTDVDKLFVENFDNELKGTI